MILGLTILKLKLKNVNLEIEVKMEGPFGHSGNLSWSKTLFEGLILSKAGTSNWIIAAAWAGFFSMTSTLETLT